MNIMRGVMLGTRGFLNTKINIRGTKDGYDDCRADD